jgi:hypothetical protein
LLSFGIASAFFLLIVLAIRGATQLVADASFFADTSHRGVVAAARKGLSNRSIIAVACAFAILAVGWEMHNACLIPQGKIVIHVVGPFEKASGSHLIADHYALKAFDDFADSETDKEASLILLYEDGRPLGPAHSNHGDIATLGMGRFSHWKGQGLIFSTGDNSDPDTNEKVYYAVIPR